MASSEYLPRSWGEGGQDFKITWEEDSQGRPTKIIYEREWDKSTINLDFQYIN